MKIRSGFVSNSSTSSFLIIGTFVDEDEFYKLHTEEYYDKGIETYQGYETGYCVGVDAYPYLEKDKLYDAVNNAEKFIKENIPEGLLKDKSFNLMYDCYDD